jgi:hypothetical protein
VAVSCECGNELSIYRKCGEFLETKEMLASEEKRR